MFLRLPRLALLCAGLTVAAAALPPLVAAPQQREANLPVGDIEPMPVSLDGCEPATAAAPSAPVIVGADARSRALYQCGDVGLAIDVARYQRQWPGKEAVNHLNQPSDLVRASAAERRFVTAGDGYTVREYAFESRDTGFTIWSWYVVGESPTARSYVAKLKELGNAALFRDAETTLVTLTTWSDNAARGRRLTTLQEASEALSDWKGEAGI